MASSTPLLSPAPPTLPALRSLVCMAAALALAGWPLQAQAPDWTCLFFLGCAAVRPLLQWRRWPLPGLPLRLGLLGLGVFCVYVSTGTLMTIEAGLGILLVLIGTKLLETRTRRDLMVLALLGYFLGLCALFFSQGLGQWLYVGFTSLLLTAALVHLHEPAGEERLWPALRLGATLVLQALPLVLLFFLFCPRPHAELRLFFGGQALGGTGMGDRLQPGSIASQTLGTSKVFRVAFPEGNIPPRQALYWRGLVLWDCDGMVWERNARILPEPPVRAGAGPRIRQLITLYPHGANWLFALDRPVSVPRLAEPGTGNILRSRRPVLKQTPYEVISQLQSQETALTPEQARASLQRPVHVSPEVQALADSFREGATNSREIAQRALLYLREQHFTYTVEPGKYPSRELDEFLFTRRAGYCEHYAAAFATLMRLSGVHARIVAGYLGGSYNSFGHWFEITQADAHAWCEIWEPQLGWLRIDPTSVTAPDRISQGFQQFIASRQGSQEGTANRMPGAKLWQRLSQSTSMVWNNLSYQWDAQVLAFDEEHQQSFLATLGMGRWEPSRLLLLVAGSTVGLVGALAWWLSRAPAPRELSQRLWLRFCRRAARAGVRRAEAEGPLAFTERAAGSFPEQAGPIREFGEMYAAAEYGARPPAPERLRQAYRQIPRLPRSTPQAGEPRAAGPAFPLGKAPGPRHPAGVE